MLHILKHITKDEQIKMISRNKGKSLLDTYPEIANEWDYDANIDLRPEMVGAKSYYHVGWICPIGHKYEADVSSRTHKHSNCPYCAGKKLLSGYNDFATKYPKLLKEWDYDKNEIDPKTIFSHSKEKVWWKCRKGHSWQAQVVNRVAIGSGCLYCSKQKADTGVNDLATLYPQALKNWDYENNEILPSEVLPNSTRIVNWKCKNGHTWQNAIGNELVKNFQCSYCNKTKMYVGETDLFSVYPEFKEFFCDELNENKTLHCYSKEKIWWKQKCGHKFQRSVLNFLSSQDCPYCGNFKLLKGFNDFNTRYPHMLSKWDYDKNKNLPENQLAGGTARIHWKCELGHTWSKTADNSVRKGINCPYCSNKILLPGFNDLETKFPEIAKEWNYEKNSFKPSEVVYGSGLRAWFKCKKGHEWSCVIKSRTMQGTNCPHCGETKGETAVRKFLEENHIDFTPQGSFEGCKDINTLSFDFVLSDNKTAIEYDGIQHFKPVDFAGKGKKWAEETYKKNIRHDKIKSEYCKKNGIKLIRISYKEYEQIENILSEKLTSYL